MLLRAWMLITTWLFKHHLFEIKQILTSQSHPLIDISLCVYISKVYEVFKSLFAAWKMLQLPAFSNHPNFFFHI